MSDIKEITKDNFDSAVMSAKGMQMVYYYATWCKPCQEMEETHKLSGWPMEIIINDRLFGRGEVVVVGDNLAIRITDLKKPDLT